MSKKLIAGAGVVASLAVALAPLATFATQAGTASDTHTDELVPTILPSCTFGDWNSSTSPMPSGITHTGTDGSTTWNTTAQTGQTGVNAHSNDDKDSTGYGTLAGEGANVAPDTEAEPLVAGNLNPSEHTAYRTMNGGTFTADFARTQMRVVCTNTEGYTIEVATPNLAYESNDGTTPIYATNGTAVSGAASTYNLVSITAPNGANSASDVVVSANYANATAGTAEAIVKHTGVSAETGDTISVVYGVGVKPSQKAGTYSGKVVYSLFQGITSN